ncbi:hypothetical protein OAP14_02690 [Aliiglaciecola sp.]|nr:hypothetical protein [Aliiglaciecola sp.]
MCLVLGNAGISWRKLAVRVDEYTFDLEFIDINATDDDTQENAAY